MLVVENRNNKDDRTMGELFFLVHDELQDINFSEVCKPPRIRCNNLPPM